MVRRSDWFIFGRLVFILHTYKFVTLQGSACSCTSTLSPLYMFNIIDNNYETLAIYWQCRCKCWIYMINILKTKILNVYSGLFSTLIMIGLQPVYPLIWIRYQFIPLFTNTTLKAKWLTSGSKYCKLIMVWRWMFPYKRVYFYHFLKNRENSNYLNYLENSILNESLKVAVYIKININRLCEVILHQNKTPRTWFFKQAKQQLISKINREHPSAKPLQLR